VAFFFGLGFFFISAVCYSPDSSASTKIIGKIQTRTLPSDTFDCVVTTEMLEHDARFWISILQFNRVLRAGGFLLVTTRNVGFWRHDYPSDFWRFTADGLRELFKWGGFVVLEALDDEADQGTYAVGRKAVNRD